MFDPSPAAARTEISVFLPLGRRISITRCTWCRGACRRSSPSLPPDTRFYINRLTFSAFPMIGFSLTSTSAAASPSCATLRTTSWRRASTVSRDVAEARIAGGRAPEIHVIVDPES